MRPPQRLNTPGRPTHVVMMGDLIQSEAAPSIEILHRRFNFAIDKINEDYANSLISPLTITLGDEFQGLCGSISEGLEIVHALRLLLLTDSVECRFAVGVASLETPVQTDRAWNMMGPGLADTRDKLSDKRNPNAYRFFFPSQAMLQDLFEAIGYALTITERRWTNRQREIAIAVLSADGSSTQIADKFELAHRTFYKIRSAANLDFYLSQWRVLTSSAVAIDKIYGLPR